MKMTEIFKPKSGKEIWDGLNHLCTNLMLIESARGGFMPGVEKALKQGADINYYNDSDGCSALAAASEAGNFQIVNYLLSKNAIVCNIALIGAFERIDLFTKLLQPADLEECCGLRLALEFAEGQHRTEIVALIRERIKRG
jgi:ankyrin repeat protein